MDGSVATDNPIRLLASVPAKADRRQIVRYPYQTDRDYAVAYHESAQRLALTFKGQPIDDLILLPLLTLYRQAYELQLKNAIRSLVEVRTRYVEGPSPELTEAVTEVRFKNFGHNLHKLLNEVLLHYGTLKMPEPFSSGVTKVIQWLHEADKTGTAFRYSGRLPDTQESADFPDLIRLLDGQFKTLVAVTDYVEGLYEDGPTLEER